jgi:hypothetical protein
MVYQEEIIETKPAFRKRWPILCFCLAVIFFVIGGGLLGAWASKDAQNQCETTSGPNLDNFNDNVTYSNCYPKGALWDAGLACIALGVIFKLAFWITLIIWCIKRRNNRQTVVYVNGPQQYEPYRGA